MLGEVRVLLVEDDDTIAEPLIDGLSHYGFSVDHVQTGREALARRDAELVLLDLGLPDIDGIEVCRQLRSHSAVPVIMLTARGSEVDRVVGLELGADDYLTKPFSVRELVARIRAVTRRTQTLGETTIAQPELATAEALTDPSRIQLGQLTIDRRTRQVRLDAQVLLLAPKEFDLLALLASDPGAVFTRQRIVETVWHPHYVGSTKTLDFHVAALRRKLGDPAWLETVRGVGFRLVDPSGPAVGPHETRSEDG